MRFNACSCGFLKEKSLQIALGDRVLKPSPKELGTSATMISLSSLLPFLMSYEHDLSESGVFQSTFHIFSWLASQNLHSDSHGSRRPMLAVGGLHIESLRLDGHNQVLAKKARSAKGTTGYTSICVFHLIHTYIHTQTQIYIYIHNMYCIWNQPESLEKTNSSLSST